jgi:hypothetical protein
MEVGDLELVEAREVLLAAEHLIRRQFAWVELAQVVFFSSVMYGTFLPIGRGVELKKRDSSMSRYNSAVV